MFVNVPMRYTSKEHEYKDHCGFSIVELMIVMVFVVVIAGIAVPRLMSILSNLRTAGDARDLNGAIILAKMRASSNYARARVFANLSAKTFRVEWQQSGTTTWTAEGGDQPLSSGVSFGYGSLATPPASTQASLGQAPLCSGASNTACITFNSRGIPIDATTLTPTADDAIYITDGKSVTGVTVSVSGLTAIWRSDASTANWSKR
jgi:Tfp pilus assembly protein FimT